MSHSNLIELLERYLCTFPEERVCVDHVRQFVRARRDCFDRSCPDGHITASAWIVSHDLERVLLTHHRKLGFWLQLGGHADGDMDPERVALTEAREESGMSEFRFVADPDGMRLLDVDVHRIPERRGEPEHLHHDLLYLLIAAPDQPLRISEESNDLAWFSWEDATRLIDRHSRLRKAPKARERLQI